MKRYLIKIALAAGLLALAAVIGQAAAQPTPSHGTSSAGHAPTETDATGDPAAGGDANAPADANSALQTGRRLLAEMDPAARAVLERLQQAGARYPRLRAEMTYEVNDRLSGDQEIRTGWVAFANAVDDEPARFRVHFETLRHGRGRPTLDQIDYAFDGQFFTVAKHRARQMIRSQLPSDARPMEIGSGYFPMPFGQRAAEVARYFTARTRRTGPSDPNDTSYVRLTPRDEFRRKFDLKRVELWIDDKTHLPRRISTLDRHRKQTTVDFSAIDTKPELSDELFALPRRPGWSYHVKSWRDSER